jgi:DNA-binding beta-propeller fold protein YncE
VTASLALATPASGAITFVSKWGAQGTAESQFNQPRSVATDSAGNVYVADQLNARVQKFGPDGTFLLMWGYGVDNGSAMPQVCTSGCQAGLAGPGPGQFASASPAGVAVDAADNVYLADRNNHRIQKFTSGGAFLDEFGSFGSPEGQLSQPEGVAVDSAGNVYVAELGNDRVQMFNAAGTFLRMWGWGVDDGSAAPQVCTSGCQAGISGSGDAQFADPWDLALDGSGNVYVAEDGNNRIQKFDGNGTFVTKWGSAGTADGQFLGARGVTVGSGGTIYATDFNNRRLQEFTDVGGFLEKFGDATLWNRPVDVAERSGTLYVADMFGHSIFRLQDAAGGGPPPPPPPPGRRTLADLPNPVQGTNVNVDQVAGNVLVGLRAAAAGHRARASQKGVRFVPLTEARQIPVGSFLDTRRGTVRLQSARDRRGTRQQGDFRSGLFQVLQSRKSALTTLTLKGASFRNCPRGKRARAAASIRRRLRANARGRFRTRGRHSAATVRGTVWLTADRCDGTLTKVTRGRVAVRDFRRKRTVVVRRGKSYLARAPR